MDHVQLIETDPRVSVKIYTLHPLRTPRSYWTDCDCQAQGLRRHAEKVPETADCLAVDLSTVSCIGERSRIFIGALRYHRPTDAKTGWAPLGVGSVALDARCCSSFFWFLTIFTRICWAQRHSAAPRVCREFGTQRVIDSVWKGWKSVQAKPSRLFMKNCEESHICGLLPGCSHSSTSNLVKKFDSAQGWPCRI